LLSGSWVPVVQQAHRFVHRQAAKIGVQPGGREVMVRLDFDHLYHQRVLGGGAVDVKRAHFSGEITAFFRIVSSEVGVRDQSGSGLQVHDRLTHGERRVPDGGSESNRLLGLAKGDRNQNGNGAND
jgi:hypothetical protein